MDNTLLNLHNSSYPAQPHSLIGENYFALVDVKNKQDFKHYFLSEFKGIAKIDILLITGSARMLMVFSWALCTQ